jgi:L-fuculose-phosphate aldolase
MEGANVKMSHPDDLRACGATLLQRHLVWGKSGNISLKIEPDAFFISATGSNLGLLSDRDIVLCRISQDTWQGMRHPSMEREMHRSIYQVNELAAAIIHSQPFYATLMACSDTEIETDLIPEAMAYLGKVSRVPYHHAGSKELARSVAERSRFSQVLLLENHGVVSWGASLDEALMNTETLEFLCRLLVTAGVSGWKLKHLGEAVLGEFRAHLTEINRQP